jgi:hypothetical protein
MLDSDVIAHIFPIFIPDKPCFIFKAPGAYHRDYLEHEGHGDPEKQHGMLLREGFHGEETQLLNTQRGIFEGRVPIVGRPIIAIFPGRISIDDAIGTCRKGGEERTLFFA